MQRVNPHIGIGAEWPDMAFFTADDVFPHCDGILGRTTAEIIIPDNPADKAHFTGRDQPFIPEVVLGFDRDIQFQRVGKDRTI